MGWRDTARGNLARPPEARNRAPHKIFGWPGRFLNPYSHPVRFDPARRPESRPKDSPSRSLAALALCVALAFTMVLGSEFARAQTTLSPIDSLRLADSLAQAESLRVQDS